MPVGIESGRVEGTLRQLASYRKGHLAFTNVALCLCGLALLLLARQFVSEGDHFTIGFSGCSGWSVTVFSLAVMLVLTQPTDKWTLRIIIGFAIAFQAVTFFADPFLSSDIYRYVWDGVVQHAHINPYRYVPGDPALTYLRAPNQDVFDLINRRDYAPTIYPPVAQMIYWFATFFSPSVAAMKAAMIGFEVVTATVLIKLLRALGRRPTDVLLFCWCPLAVWEIGGSGHVDAAILAWVALALLCYTRRMPGWTGFFLGLAVMTKFYPLVLLPVLWRRGDWKMPASLAGVVLGGYAVYLSVGSKVFGFLHTYTKEEGMDTGTRYFLLDYVRTLPGLHTVPTNAFLLASALTFGVILLWAWRRGLWHAGPAPSKEITLAIRASMGLAFAMMLLFSPHYPWYILWLLPFFCLQPRWTLFAYVVAFFYGFTTRFATPGPLLFILDKWLYAAVALSFLVQYTWSRFQLRRWILPASLVEVTE